MSTNKTTRPSVIACAAVFMSMAAGSALGGEITGNGKSLKNPDGTLNGKSQCAFSGRQDDFSQDEGLFKHRMTQSWGQVFKELKAVLPHPGTACNPTKSQGEP